MARGGQRMVAWTLSAAFALAGPVRAATDPLPRAPTQQFVAPAPGTYRLEVIQQAPAGRVLDSDGRALDFKQVTTGRITLLSFIYTYCVDPIGCPLAHATFATLRTQILATPALAGQVRFVSLSFDPVNDTPAAMKAYGGEYATANAPLRWYFLTTGSMADLKPLVDGLGQSAAVQTDADGRPTRLYDHLLKVFLLDAQGRIREIYTTAFLLPDVIFNDIQTLVIEQHARRPKP